MQVPEFLCVSGYMKNVKTLLESAVSVIDKCSVGILCHASGTNLYDFIEWTGKSNFEDLSLGINSREMMRFVERFIRKCSDFYSLQQRCRAGWVQFSWRMSSYAGDPGFHL